MGLSTTGKRYQHTGSGTGPYSFPYKFYADSDLKVIKKLIASPYTETTLALNTDYTVSGAGSSSGGSVTLLASLSSSYHLIIIRNRALTQITDIRNQGAYDPADIEDTLDQIMTIIQGLQDQIDRSVKNSDGVPSSTFDPTLPIDLGNYGGRVPVLNSAGTAFDLVTNWPSGSDITSAKNVSGSYSAPNTIAAGAISFSGNYTFNDKWVKSDGGQVTIASLSNGTFEGQMLSLIGASDTDYLTLPGDGTVTNVKLDGDIDLLANVQVTMRWSADQSLWIQHNRNDGA